jgi:hypothetical protein
MDEFQNLKITPRTLFCDICPPKHLVDQFVGAEGIVLDHHYSVKFDVGNFGERGFFADEKTKIDSQQFLIDSFRSFFWNRGRFRVI